MANSTFNWKHILVLLAMVSACLLVYVFLTWSDLNHEDIVTVSNATQPEGARRPQPRRYLRLTGFGGRLGNQMFKYNSLLGIADSAKMIPALDVGDKHAADFRKIFDLTPGVITKDVSIINRTYDNTIQESASSIFTPRLMARQGHDTLLVGLLQSYKYFHHISPRIRREMRFKRDIRLRAEASLRRTLSSKSLGPNVTYIGVHARRTDIARPRLRSIGFNTPNETYYHKAMAYFKRRYPNTMFVVASDDLNWAKEHIQGNRSDAVALVKRGAPEVDLAILAMCNHTILSIGTYGWWGAWLAGGEAVYYSDHPVPGSSLSRRFNSSDYYPPHWVGLQ